MFDLETFNTPGLFHEGVLYIGDKPHYIVEYFNEEGLETFVTVYDVAEESKREDAPEEARMFPRKAYETKVERRGFGRDTILSRLAAEKYDTEESIRYVDRPPIFMSPIEYGRDTFHDIEGQGFFEKTKDRYKKVGGQIIAEGGHKTGVFITLESIDWKKKYIPTEEVLNQYSARMSVWGDLI